jgi:hypothetical protein
VDSNADDCVGDAVFPAPPTLLITAVAAYGVRVRLSVTFEAVPPPRSVSCTCALLIPRFFDQLVVWFYHCFAVFTLFVCRVATAIGRLHECTAHSTRLRFNEKLLNFVSLFGFTTALLFSRFLCAAIERANDRLSLAIMIHTARVVQRNITYLTIMIHTARVCNAISLTSRS